MPSRGCRMKVPDDSDPADDPARLRFQRLADAGNVGARAEERQPQPVDEDRPRRAERLVEVEPAAGARGRQRRGVLGEVGRHAGHADAADHLAAAIDRNAAGVDRHGVQLILAGVEDVRLAGGDPDRRQHVALVVEHRSAARAAARVGRLAGERRAAGAGADHAGDPDRPRVRRVEDGVPLDVDLAAAVDVLDAVERGGAGVLHARRKVDAADEADRARRERRLIVGEHRAAPRHRDGHVGRPLVGARPRVDAEDLSRAVHDRRRQRVVGQRARRHRQHGAHVVGGENLRDAARLVRGRVLGKEDRGGSDQEGRGGQISADSHGRILSESGVPN